MKTGSDNNTPIDDAPKRPHGLWIWMLEIIMFSMAGYGLLGLYLYILPNVSPSSLTAWTSFTCIISAGVMLIAMLYKNSTRHTVAIIDNTYQGIVNAGFTVVATLLSIWLIYAPLVIGRSNKNPAIRHQLALLLFPESYPWQGVNIVLGISFLAIITMLHLGMSVSATVQETQNTYFINVPFSFFVGMCVVLIQAMANRGLFVCSMRTFSWNASDNNMYSILNEYWMYMLLVNTMVVLSFALQIASDITDNAFYRRAHCAYIACFLLAFLLADSSSSLGKREIIGQKPQHQFYHLCVTFSIVVKMFMFLLLTGQGSPKDKKEPLPHRPNTVQFHSQPPRVRLRVPKLQWKTD